MMKLRAPVAVAAIAALCAAVPAPATAAPGKSAAPDPGAPKSGTVRGAKTVRPDARRTSAVAKFRELHRQRIQPQALEQIHHFWGVEPTPSSHDGMQATQSVGSSTPTPPPSTATGPTASRS